MNLFYNIIINKNLSKARGYYENRKKFTMPVW